MSLSAAVIDEIEALLARIRTLISAPDEKTASPPPEPEPKETKDYFSDYGSFYDFLRGNSLLGPVISQTEFDGCDRIIKSFATAGAPVSYCAYGLATAYLETAHTMQPIDEYGGNSYFTRMYDIDGARPDKARELGNLAPGDGARYHGRGDVQLTGKKNYARATEKLRAMGIDVDLVANPDDAKRPDVAAAVMAQGMIEGWFTGRRLSDDLPASGPGSLSQFAASRDIINGTNKADDIAHFAVDFQTGLMRAGYTV